jgi:hypothetical protein
LRLPKWALRRWRSALEVLGALVLGILVFRFKKPHDPQIFSFQKKTAAKPCGLVRFWDFGL